MLELWCGWVGVVSELQASLKTDKQEVLDRWTQYFADLMKMDKKIADQTQEESESYVYWTVHHCDS